MKSILFITYMNPDRLNAGDHVYTWEILEALKRMGCYVHVVTYGDREIEENGNSLLVNKVDKVTFVKHKQESKIKLALSKHPATIANRFQKGMIDAVNGALKEREYDAVILNMFKMTFLSDFINAKNIIYISHNNETLTAKSIFESTSNYVLKLVYYIDYLKTKIYEKRFLKNMSHITAISDVDVISLKNIAKDKEIKVLPPIVELTNATAGKDMRGASNNVIICGSFTWVAKVANLMAFLKAPTLNKLYENNIKVLIVGRANEDLVNMINSKYKGVVMTGTVDSVQPYYDRSQIAVVPEKTGGGFKLKIAEAVQNRIPIIAIKGAVTDSEMIPNIHYIEVENFEDMPDAILDLYKDKVKMSYLVSNCTELFAKKYSLNNMIKTLESII